MKNEFTNTPTSPAGIYVREFRTNARGGRVSILNESGPATRWFRMGVPVADAIAWADQGYLPGEAAPLIAQGITPQMAAAASDAAVEVAGSPEEAAMQEIDRLVANGTFIDPRRVRFRQDPDDPDFVHVDILPEGQTWDR